MLLTHILQLQKIIYFYTSKFVIGRLKTLIFRFIHKNICLFKTDKLSINTWVQDMRLMYALRYSKPNHRTLALLPDRGKLIYTMLGDARSAHCTDAGSRNFREKMRYRCKKHKQRIFLARLALRTL